MDNLKLLQAMLFRAETLNYSQSYKKDLMDEISSMIEQELNSVEHYYKYSGHPEPDFDSAGFSILDREPSPSSVYEDPYFNTPTEADSWDGDESDKALQ